jgi:tetratricopeptide (TPR) repeat protein
MKILLFLIVILSSFSAFSGERNDQHLKRLGELDFKASSAQNEGRYKESEKYRKELIQVMRSIGFSPSEIARQLSNLSSVQNLNGNGVAAEKSARDAIAILKEYPTSDKLQIAILNGNLGGALLLQDKLGESRSLYNEELASLKKIGMKDSHFAASAKIGIGEIEAKNGNYLVAKTLYEEALSVFLKISDESHPLTSKYLKEYKAIVKNAKNQ